MRERVGADAVDLGAHGDEAMRQIAASPARAPHWRAPSRRRPEHAAISAFSVAPTVTNGKHDLRAVQPLGRLALRRSLRSSSISAPNASKAFRCRSTGRVPMAQPPGNETRACAAARQQRPQHQNRGAHLAHQIVGRGRASKTCAQVRSWRIARAVRSQPPTPSLPSRCAIVEMSADGAGSRAQRVVGKKARRHQGESGVLCAGDGQRAGERAAAANADAVHEDPFFLTSIALHAG